jgi:hypothetical protein
MRRHHPAPRPDGKIPLITRYDGHEDLGLPPSPLLFQRRGGTGTRQISTGTVRNMPNAALTQPAWPTPPASR